MVVLAPGVKTFLKHQRIPMNRVLRFGHDKTIQKLHGIHHIKRGNLFFVLQGDGVQIKILHCGFANSAKVWHTGS